MPQSHNPTLTLLAQRVAAVNTEIEMIFADAERRAAPLRAKLQRLQIAEEELRDLDPGQALLPLVNTAEAPKTHFARLVRRKRPIKSLIEEELTASALPLSKAEFMERFSANGRQDLHDSTVGSTLSRLVADGFLVKDGTNRYRLNRGSTAQPSQAGSTQEEEAL